MKKIILFLLLIPLVYSVQQQNSNIKLDTTVGSGSFEANGSSVIATVFVGQIANQVKVTNFTKLQEGMMYYPVAFDVKPKLTYGASTSRSRYDITIGAQQSIFFDKVNVEVTFNNNFNKDLKNIFFMYSLKDGKMTLLSESVDIFQGENKLKRQVDPDVDLDMQDICVEIHVEGQIELICAEIIGPKVNKLLATLSVVMLVGVFIFFIIIGRKKKKVKKQP